MTQEGRLQSRWIWLSLVMIGLLVAMLAIWIFSLIAINQQMAAVAARLDEMNQELLERDSALVRLRRQMMEEQQRFREQFCQALLTGECSEKP